MRENCSLGERDSCSFSAFIFRVTISSHFHSFSHSCTLRLRYYTYKQKKMKPTGFSFLREKTWFTFVSNARYLEYVWGAYAVRIELQIPKACYRSKVVYLITDDEELIERKLIYE